MAKFEENKEMEKRLKDHRETVKYSRRRAEANPRKYDEFAILKDD